VLPKALREELRIRPGDEVTVEPREGGLLVRRVPHGSALYGMLADSDVDFLARLETQRRLDREREDHQAFG